MRKIILCLVLLLMFAQVAFASFSDVNSDNPFFEAIDYVQTQGIVNGYPDKTYKPDQTINRNEFVKIIINAVYSQKEIDDCIFDKQFTDVKTDDWAYKYICVARNYNIIDGYPDGTFKQTNKINLAEAAKIISSAMSLSYEEDIVWYKPFLKALSGKKAIPSSITFIGQYITRGEMAELIWRLKANPQIDEYMVFSGEQLNPVISDMKPIQLSNDYSKDADFAYWRGEKIAGSDGSTFEYLGGFYAKDKISAYYFGKQILGSDAASFIYLVNTYDATGDYYAHLYVGDQYAKDKNNSYYQGAMIKGSDATTFAIIGQNYTKGKFNAYWYGNKIAGSDGLTFKILDNEYIYAKDENFGYFNAQPISGSDPATFEVLNILPDYARDKNVGYYRDEAIKGSDGATFLYIGNNLAKDKNYTYLLGSKVEEDGSTIEVLNYNYTKDKDYGYFNNQAIEGSDGGTFEALSPNFAKDKNVGYFGDYAIPGSDGPSFQMVGGGQGYFEKNQEDFVKDKNVVYYRSKAISGSDPDTFVFLDYGYAKDKDQVYFFDHKSAGKDNFAIEGADSGSFKTLYWDYAKDKNTAYFADKKIKDSDAATFEVIINAGNVYIKDKNHEYSQGEIKQ